MSTTEELKRFWSDQLLIALQDRDWAESMLDGRLSSQEIRVTAIAITAIEERLARIIASLDGLTSPW